MSETNAKSKSEAMSIVFRKMNFELEKKDTKKYWHGDSPFITLFWSALSAAFPEGERFFMDSGRYYKKEIKDPVLKEQFADFIRQEAHHTYQHKRLNSLVAGFDVDMEKYDGWFGWILNLVKDKIDPMKQLAVSVGLEHFTANFAHQYLSNEKFTRGVDPEIKALWSWHAAEEIEHKGVLFDLYKEVGGGYFTRVIAMSLAWLIIIVMTLTAQFQMIAKDGNQWNVRDNLKGLWYLFGYGGLLTNMMPEFFRYFKPSFHPWDLDDQNYIDAWFEDNSDYVTNLPPAG
ncbi:MAG: metal-dependent hydrolase [Moraxellaceae bacterium]|nr:MAG: metal-dependent hydrolase [Moraxellaceae bacterium]